MPLVAALLATALPQCPSLEGVWVQGKGERVLVMQQDGCRLTGTVAEPANQVLHVRGFWDGSIWPMAATRLGKCATTAWGSIRAGPDDTLLVHVRGSDGLCGPDGSPGSGPRALDVTITYRRPPR